MIFEIAYPDPKLKTGSDLVTKLQIELANSDIVLGIDDLDPKL